MLQNCIQLGRLCSLRLRTGIKPNKACCPISQPMAGWLRRSFVTSPAHPEQLPSEQTLVVSADQERKLKILQLEVDVLRQEGRRVPLNIKPDQWSQILALPTKSARGKYYGFLWTNEKKRENDQARKERKREQMAEKLAERAAEHEQSPHIVYSLSGTSYFLRIYETTMNHWHNNKLIRAMQFGQKLVIDCSYDEHMTKRECILAAKQLMFCFAENRYHDHPFDLHFCNANMAGHTMDYLRRHIPTMLEPAFPMNVHSGSFTEHFPKERLVYLSPHCKNDLVAYDPDDVYIIGAMVDTMHNEPLSLAKAKKLGLRMARLPLDRYLQWGSGSGKSLTLNQMTHILLDLKSTGDWTKALSHVPRRKLVLGGTEDALRERDGRRKWSNGVEDMRMSNAGIDRDPNASTGRDSTESVNKFRRKKL